MTDHVQFSLQFEVILSRIVLGTRFSSTIATLSIHKIERYSNLACPTCYCTWPETGFLVFRCWPVRIGAIAIES